MISRRALVRGFTLVELMISLVMALGLAGVLLKLQARVTEQLARSSDVSQRDDQARTAVDRIVRDLSGAGFLFGGTQTVCNAIFSYNSAAATVTVRHPVDALAAATGTGLPFGPSLTLNYPSAGITSDVLYLTGSTGAARFNDSVAPMLNVAPSASVSPMTTGLLPMYSTTGLTAGDAGILMVRDSGKVACLRVPITSLTATQVSSSGTTMPPSPAYYGGFATKMSSAGFTGPLSDAEIFQGRIFDLGSAANSTAVTTAYYIDGSTYAFPALMRATFSMADDTLISTQAIAAGVISLQVRFGVDTAGGNTVTEYDTAATVTANNRWDMVRSVRFLVVSRSLVDDPNTGYTWPSSPTVGIAAPFTDITIPTSPVNLTHRRYAIAQSELAVRSVLWR